MRAAAEVEPLALMVDFEVLIGRDHVDELDLEGLALVGEPGLGLIAVPQLLGERSVLGDDLAHALFDRGKVVRGERLGAGKVVVEAVFDHRADRDLGAGPQPLHRLGEHVRRVVADQFERARVLAADELEGGIGVDRIGKVAEHPVAHHRHGALEERGGDRPGDVGAGQAGLERARGAVRKRHGNHGFAPAAHSPIRVGVSGVGIGKPRGRFNRSASPYGPAGTSQLGQTTRVGRAGDGSGWRAARGAPAKASRCASMRSEARVAVRL